MKNNKLIIGIPLVVGSIIVGAYPGMYLTLKGLSTLNDLTNKNKSGIVHSYSVHPFWASGKPVTDIQMALMAAASALMLGAGIRQVRRRKTA